MERLTAFDEAIEQGLEIGLKQGREQGREEGREQGREEGEVKGEIRVLLMQGRKRFGPPSAAIEAELTAIHDLARLDRMAEMLLTASAWEEVLSTP